MPKRSHKSILGIAQKRKDRKQATQQHFYNELLIYKTSTINLPE